MNKDEPTYNEKTTLTRLYRSTIEEIDKLKTDFDLNSRDAVIIRLIQEYRDGQ